MKTLREVVHTLVLAHVFEVFRSGDSSPENVPFGAVRPDNPKPCILEGINNRVINVRGLGHLEAQGHRSTLHVSLVQPDDLQKLGAVHSTLVIQNFVLD